MGYFAEIDPTTKKVLRVIVAEQDFINSGKVGNLKNWIETSNNIRYNFAGVGFTFDEENDAFIPIKPYKSWILDRKTFQYIAPKDKPDEINDYGWNELEQKWDLITF